MRSGRHGGLVTHVTATWGRVGRKPWSTPRGVSTPRVPIPHHVCLPIPHQVRGSSHRVPPGVSLDAGGRGPCHVSEVTLRERRPRARLRRGASVLVPPSTPTPVLRTGAHRGPSAGRDGSWSDTPSKIGGGPNHYARCDNCHRIRWVHFGPEGAYWSRAPGAAGGRGSLTTERRDPEAPSACPLSASRWLRPV